MTTAYVYASLPGAQALATAVDARMGYPRPGLDIGPGPHGPAAQSVTQTYASVLAHPTLPQWAYVADNNTAFIVGPNAIALQLPAPTTLDVTWANATPVVGGSTGATGATAGTTGASAQALQVQGTVVVIP